MLYTSGDFGGSLPFKDSNLDSLTPSSPDSDIQESITGSGNYYDVTKGTYGYDQSTTGDFGSYYPLSGESASGVFGDYPSDYQTGISGEYPDDPEDPWKPETVLEKLAQKIYDQEFAYEEGERRIIEIKFIRDWLEGNLGELNILIYTDFHGPDPEGLNLEEQAILRELYIVDYNRRANRNALRFINGFKQEEIDWFVIKEGDSSIQRTTHTHKEVASKNYRLAAKDAQQRVEHLVFNYNLYHSKPSQVYSTIQENQKQQENRNKRNK